jgi:uncharacterized protein
MQVDERLLEFIGKLRDAGLQVSLAESMDACEAVKIAPLDSMLVFRSALRATLAKSESDYPVFDAVFDEYFRGAEAIMAGAPEEPSPGSDDGFATATTEQLSEMLRQALASGSADELAALARMAAATIGQMEGGFGRGSRPLAFMAGSGYYMFRGMEMLKFGQLTEQLRELAAAGELATDLPPALASEELEERLEQFREALEREIRRQLGMARGEEAARRTRKLPVRPEEIDFSGASLKQVEDMRRVLPALARKLAARIARRTSGGKRGRLDIRSTLRHSISSGGVPIDVKYRKRAPAKPELFILCDVSGSVRTFSTFTLQLVYSLHQQFKAVRSFAFIDRVDEVTELFNMCEVDEAIERVYREGVLVDGDGHSDVGRALDLFYREFGSELSPRSTVLILSDGRNNARDPRAWALENIDDMARRVYWLNPEPRERWDTGDSIMAEYEEYCHAVQECRNLKQLADFVYRRA